MCFFLAKDFAKGGFCGWNNVRLEMSGTVDNDLLTCIDMLTTWRMLCLFKGLQRIDAFVYVHDIIFIAHQRCAAAYFCPDVFLHLSENLWWKIWRFCLAFFHENYRKYITTPLTRHYNLFSNTTAHSRLFEFCAWKICVCRTNQRRFPPSLSWRLWETFTCTQPSCEQKAGLTGRGFPKMGIQSNRCRSTPFEVIGQNFKVKQKPSRTQTHKGFLTNPNLKTPNYYVVHKTRLIN